MMQENKNQMIESKENFLEKIKKFIRKAFGKKSINSSEEKVETNIDKQSEKMNNFTKAIKITKDPEMERLLKLQEEFREGKITQGELSNQDIDKLGRLYDEQIKRSVSYGI